MWGCESAIISIYHFFSLYEFIKLHNVQINEQNSSFVVILLMYL